MRSLTCLGTSDAFGSAGRHCAGYLLDTGHGRILIDAGPGLLTALKALGRDTEQIDAVVLSHLHGDHFAGVPFLLLEYSYESPRSRPLLVVGPPDTERRVYEAYHALYAETRGQKLPFEIRFVELGDGDATEVMDARVESFRVPHQETQVSLGHRLRFGDRIVVYSGDTAWTPDLLRQSSGADLFLCECSTFDTQVPRHVRYVEIEANRRSFDCDRLVLTHLGREVRERSAEIGEELANDGLEIALG
ncbi:MAG: MBL fold metallo-hydrolase [Thermodesulfobacteriota bacterium]